jgi:hypothetical protein
MPKRKVEVKMNLLTRAYTDQARNVGKLGATSLHDPILNWLTLLRRVAVEECLDAPVQYVRLVRAVILGDLDDSELIVAPIIHAII